MRVLLAILPVIGLFNALAPKVAQAHEETELSKTAVESIFDRFFVYDQLTVAFAASIIIFTVVIIVLLRRPRSGGAKVFFFGLIALSVIAATTYIGGTTLYMITRSPTGGPVHWHADFRIVNCGEEVDLIDAGGLSNRVGTPLFHEHGDSRIHIEGITRSVEDANFHRFFEVVGGELSQNMLVVPTNDGNIRMETGSLCGKATGTLQAFLWETDTDTTPWTARQRILKDFTEYIIKPEERIPPGDCVIFEFGLAKGRTEYICKQYEVAQARGGLIIEK